MYMTVKQAAEKWGISDRRVRILCAEGKVLSVIREGRRWMIPVDTRKPVGGRFKAVESLLAAIDRKKSELDTRRPLTEGEFLIIMRSMNTMQSVTLVQCNGKVVCGLCECKAWQLLDDAGKIII